MREEIKEEILGGVNVSDKMMKRFIDYQLRFTDIIIENGFEDAYRIWKKNIWRSRDVEIHPILHNGVVNMI